VDREGAVLGMRSKAIVWGYLILLSLGTIFSLWIPKNEAVAKESIIIPGDAIRLRILANSDLESDQDLKRKVRDAVNAKITLWVQDLTSMDKAKVVIKDKLPEIQTIAEKVVQDYGSKQSVKVEFGKVQFPTKLYGQFLYPAGQYQAVLITLGEGKGANWWCVLYPPLCFLDFSNGVAVSDGFEEKHKAKAKVKSTEEIAASAAMTEVAAAGDENTASSEPEEEITSAAKEQSDAKAEVTDKKAPATSAKEKSVKKVETVDEKTPAKETSAAKVEASDQNPPAENHKDKKEVSKKLQAEKPVYTSEDEDPVKVKFFVVELWKKLFD
jgi:stage II sporulation protein R